MKLRGGRLPPRARGAHRGGGLGGLAPFAPHCPLLYVYGQRKPFMFHSQAWLDELNAKLGSRAMGLPTGHWVMVEQPEAFEAELLGGWGGRRTVALRNHYIFDSCLRASHGG